MRSSPRVISGSSSSKRRCNIIRGRLLLIVGRALIHLSHLIIREKFTIQFFFMWVLNLEEVPTLRHLSRVSLKSLHPRISCVLGSPRKVWTPYLTSPEKSGEVQEVIIAPHPEFDHHQDSPTIFMVENVALYMTARQTMRTN